MTARKNFCEHSFYGFVVPTDWTRYGYRYWNNLMGNAWKRFSPKVLNKRLEEANESKNSFCDFLSLKKFAGVPWKKNGGIQALPMVMENPKEFWESKGYKYSSTEQILKTASSVGYGRQCKVVFQKMNESEPDCDAN